MQGVTTIMRTHVENVEKFINHNLGNGNLSEESTIKDLLTLISSVKEYYIPMVESMEKYAFENID